MLLAAARLRRLSPVVRVVGSIRSRIWVSSLGRAIPLSFVLTHCPDRTGMSKLLGRAFWRSSSSSSSSAPPEEAAAGSTRQPSAETIMALKSPNRCVYSAFHKGLLHPLKLTALNASGGAHAQHTSLEGALAMTQPVGSKGKRALSSEGQANEVKTASGAFQRVELQWKDVNYSVREGKGKKAVAKNVRAWVDATFVGV